MLAIGSVKSQDQLKHSRVILGSFLEWRNSGLTTRRECSRCISCSGASLAQIRGESRCDKLSGGLELPACLTD